MLPTLLHPKLVVPVTLYVAVSVGDNDVVEPLAPVLHEYEFAPVADRATFWPLQTGLGVAFSVTVGSGFTTTVIVPVDEQPDPLVPVTE